MQTYLYGAVAASYSTVHRKDSGIVETSPMRYVIDSIAVVASIREVGVAANGVESNSAEGIVDMQIDDHIAVAAEARCVGGYNHSIVEVGTTRYVVDHVTVVTSVGEVCVATYRIVALRTEGIVDMQIDNNVAVAAEASCVGGYDHSIVEVGAMRYVADIVAIVTTIDKCGIATDCVVALCAEGVVDMQTYLYSAVATSNGTVDS